MTQIKPLGEYILVEVDEFNDKSAGGVFYPTPEHQTKDDIHVWATVKAVGKGKVTKKGVAIANDVEVGDRVFFIYFLTKTKSNEQISYSLPKNHYLIKNGDILCIESKK